MKTRQISAWIAAVGLLASSAVFTSCSKDDDTATLPPIGGFNSADEVAASNLVAYWGFENSNNEGKSSTAPSKATNNSFVTGVKGQALQLNAGYLVYPTIAALSSANALPSVTVSAWVNTANNGTAATSVFALTQALATQDDWNRGPINMYVETGSFKPASDTIRFHAAFHTYSGGNYSVGGDNVNGFGLEDAGKKYQVVKGAKTWVHYVMVYDGANSTIDLYANGKLVSNSDYRKRDVGGAPIGNIVLAPPTQVLIGGWPSAMTGYTKSSDQGWQALYTGSIDELRVYSKALSTADIGSLYELEKAGR
ncbi:LamG-like jellyroll fold domain-containing protein [Larkinella terrae]|uniref:LamG domain-containing protein n=1 Tax=Larkinella terrae TaxID=2025311 RepID=A0A7K0EHN6_9BACT|nr:LamG-like jellyroll fold domain-containing protein [Larkinella terrae]MRS61359.1 hypothetical protein [Larkinella terrae]